MKLPEGTLMIFEHYFEKSKSFVTVVDWDDETECYLVRFNQQPEHLDLVDPSQLRVPYPLELALSEEI